MNDLSEEKAYDCAALEAIMKEKVEEIVCCFAPVSVFPSIECGVFGWCILSYVCLSVCLSVCLMTICDCVWVCVIVMVRVDFKKKWTK
jgi:hypothetical protein